MPRLFLSYSHDSAPHSERVLSLANRLRADGFDAMLDQYLTEPEEGWTVWMESQMRSADRILLVCTERYLARWSKEEPDGVGRGVKYEANIARALFMEDDVQNRRFTPVIFDPHDAKQIPLALRDWNYFDVSTDVGYHALLDHLDHKPRAPKPPVTPRRPR